MSHKAGSQTGQIYLLALKCADGWKLNSLEVGCFWQFVFSNRTHVLQPSLLWCCLSSSSVVVVVTVACSVILRLAQAQAWVSVHCLCFLLLVSPVVDHIESSENDLSYLKAFNKLVSRLAAFNVEIKELRMKIPDFSRYRLCYTITELTYVRSV